MPARMLGSLDGSQTWGEVLQGGKEFAWGKCEGTMVKYYRGGGAVEKTGVGVGVGVGVQHQARFAEAFMKADDLLLGLRTAPHQSHR